MTNPPPSPKQALISGAAWTVGTRWLLKAMGFVSTVVVARQLLPSDYGIVAMAMLVVGMIEAMMDFGTSTALLRKKELSTLEIDSAWTLRLMQGVCVGLLLLLASYPCALFFEEPRVEMVMWVLAASVAISGAGNIGMTLAQKEFNFALQFRHNVLCKTAGVAVTIAAAFWLGDYRALMLGIATGYTSGCLMSYVMHPYRPRFDTRGFPEIWAVSKWLMLAGVGGYFLRKSDEIVAARIGTTGEYGVYNVGSDLGQLPTGELGPAMLRAFLPVLSSIQDDIARTNTAVLKTLSAVNTITMPVGLGFAAVAGPATSLLLGASWLEAAPFVALFAVVGVVQFSFSAITTLLVLRGHARVQSNIVWVEFAIFVLGCVVLVPALHLFGLVWARIIASVASALLSILCANVYCKLSCYSVFSAVWRPLFGAVAMFLAVQYVLGSFEASTWVLLFAIFLGALLFSAWTCLTWLAAGRPEGLESTLLDLLRRR